MSFVPVAVAMMRIGEDALREMMVDVSKRHPPFSMKGGQLWTMRQSLQAVRRPLRHYSWPFEFDPRWRELRELSNADASKPAGFDRGLTALMLARTELRQVVHTWATLVKVSNAIVVITPMISALMENTDVAPMLPTTRFVAEPCAAYPVVSPWWKGGWKVGKRQSLSRPTQNEWFYRAGAEGAFADVY